ncbi:hypothetical protein HPO96_34195 [Kribbella sandramycini]|uniref:DNA-binding SARP family transcriptional activator n=1 Tax=Kribbella sandramycini TaxID=60450 RepID=A0A7Y4L8G9_9ACTN|nr:BTAD domain-containing putative transcriptional regulator [Kribbella sandramycini]MBB6570452.1 DNA-binding SARP family transcriptional activator [Kribbella sandramycini]NOL45312.1 hypothetical protein [Kribbella sandramycini]
MSESLVRVGLLGPFEVTAADGRVVDIPAGRQRALLAALALSVGRAVSVEALVERLWDDSPPVSPRSALQNNVRRLRQLLGPELIRTLAGGYALDLPPNQVDALQAVELVRQSQDAEPAAARALVAGALELWRGEPLTGVDAPVLEREHRPALLESYLTAVEARFDLDLEGIGSAGYIGELRELVGRFPLRESLWERLILALQRSGRQAEALDSYEQIRSHLAESMGADPSPRLQQLHQVLLSLAPAGGNVESPVPRQLPSPVPWFTGRSQDLKALDGLLSRTGVTIVALHGPGGIGKTTLAIHWIQRLLPSYPHGQLYVDLRGYSAEAPLSPSAALGMLLRSIGVPAGSLPLGEAELSALWRTRLAERPMLVLLDNARDAEQVRPLLPPQGSLAVVTSRNELRGLAIRDGAARHTVRAMPDADSLSLLSAVSDQAIVDHEAASDLAALCAHLPLALVIAAQQSSRYPGSSLRDTLDSLQASAQRLDLLTDPDDPTADVRGVISWSYQALAPELARSFRLIGLHPSADIEPAVAAALIDVEVEAAQRILDRLAAAHLVEMVGRTVYRSHDLVAALAAELAAADPEVDDAGARLMDWYLRSLDNARAAAFDAARQDFGGPPGPRVVLAEFAGFDDAVAWFEQRQVLFGQLMRLAVDKQWNVEAVQLATLLGDFQTARYSFEQLSTAELALQAAGRLGDAASLGRAHYLRACGLSRIGRRQEAIDEHRRALPLAQDAGDLLLQASTFGALGVALQKQKEFGAAVACHRESVTAARRLGRPQRLATSLLNLGAAESETEGTLTDAIAHTLEAVELYRSVGKPFLLGLALGNLTDMYLDAGRPETALAYSDEAMTLIGDRVEVWVRTNALIARGRVLAALGDPAGAREVWEECRQIYLVTKPYRLAEVDQLLASLAP